MIEKLGDGWFTTINYFCATLGFPLIILPFWTLDGKLPGYGIRHKETGIGNRRAL
ncbi:hypothetical protein HMPREF0240_01914 [Clostridium sp. D5]|nr:hypothetical protein HMPREF0240_01914 [Clostridium sp. D5]